MKLHLVALLSLKHILFFAVVSIFLSSCISDEDIAQVTDNVDIVEVSIAPKENGLIVTWTFDDPAKSFEFSSIKQLMQSRDNDWTFLESGWDFDGGSVSRSSGNEFNSFSVLIRPTTYLGSGYYAPLVKVGEGWLLHSSAIKPKFYPFEIQFVDLQENFQVLGSNGAHDGTNVLPGRSEFIYVGPNEQVTDSGVRVIESSNDRLSNIHNPMKQLLSKTLLIYEERLDIKQDEKPTLILYYNPNLPKRYKGSVSQNTIAIYIHGYSQEELAGVHTELNNLIAHESFHIWNRSKIRQNWLKEGGAEYVANRLTMHPDLFWDKAQTRLNDCLLVIGDRSIENLKLSGRSPYDCGHFAQLIAEMGAVNTSGSDILDIWKSAMSRRNASNYDLADFIDAVEIKSDLHTAKLFQRFLNGLSAQNIQGLINDLDEIGLKLVEFEPLENDNQNIRFSYDVLRMITKEECSSGVSLWRGQYGFKIALSSSEVCELTLSNDTEITHLNGINIIGDPYGAFLNARHDCQNGDEVVLSGADQSVVTTFRCSDYILNHPGLFKIVSYDQLNPLY